jgi:hypothetical protein
MVAICKIGAVKRAAAIKIQMFCEDKVVESIIRKRVLMAQLIFHDEAMAEKHLHPTESKKDDSAEEQGSFACLSVDGQTGILDATWLSELRQSTASLCEG